MTLFVKHPDGPLVRDAWNFPEAIIVHDTPEKMLPFPSDYELLCDTMALVPKLGLHERGHDRDMVLKGESGSGVNTVVLRMQGYVHDLKLGRLGDWDTELKSCMTASSVLHLEPGNAMHQEHWKATWNVLRFVRRWVGAVTHSLCVDKPPKGDMDTIRCSRRAFSKVTPYATTAALDKTDPLFEAAERVSHMWVPESPIAFGARREDGRVARVDPAVFSKGDFVDVSVSFDVVRRRNAKVNVYLRIEHVIQLAAVDNCNAASIKVLRGIGLAAPPAERQASGTMAFVEDEDDEFVL